MSEQTIRGLFQSFFAGVGSVLGACSLLFAVVGPAAAGELSYQLQSPLVGGNNAALQAAENTRANAVKQAKDRAVAEELARIRELEQAEANTPAARFLSSLESQIYFSVSQRIASSLADPNAALAPVTMGDTTVTFLRGSGTLTVTVITPTGTSTMVLPVPQ